jgi:hypothetical protein
MMADSMPVISIASQSAGVISVIFAAIAIRSNTKMMHRQGMTEICVGNAPIQGKGLG